MTHEPIEGLDEALTANPKTPAQWALIEEAAMRYRDLCKPVDVEAIRYEITDILENMGVQNLHAVMGGHKIALHLVATGLLNAASPSQVTPEMAQKALDYVDKLLAIWAEYGVVNVPIYETIRQLLKEKVGV